MKTWDRIIQSAMADGEFSSRNSLTRAWLYETLQSTGALIQNPRTTCTTSSNNKNNKTKQEKQEQDQDKNKTSTATLPCWAWRRVQISYRERVSAADPRTLYKNGRKKMNKINIRLERSVWDAKCVQCVVSRGRGHGVCYKYCMSSAICY